MECLIISCRLILELRQITDDRMRFCFQKGMIMLDTQLSNVIGYNLFQLIDGLLSLSQSGQWRIRDPQKITTLIEITLPRFMNPDGMFKLTEFQIAMDFKHVESNIY